MLANTDFYIYHWLGNLWQDNYYKWSVVWKLVLSTVLWNTHVEHATLIFRYAYLFEVDVWNRYCWVVWYFNGYYSAEGYGSEISILNWDMKLNFFGVFLFVFETPSKLFSILFTFLTILTLWFRYLQTYLQESCLYISSQLFFKTPHKTQKFPEKLKKNAFSTNLQI